MTTINTLIAIFLTSTISIGIAYFLSKVPSHHRKITEYIISFTIGVLLGDAFIHLIPESFETAETSLATSVAVIAGILLFFTLEKFLKWKHCCNTEAILESNCPCEKHHGHIDEHTGLISLAGDSIHNFIDGFLIASSFVISTPLGITTSLAVALHEIPQEIGDFTILLHTGWEKKKAFLWNGISALFAFLGGVIALIIQSHSTEKYMAITIALTAGGFIYLALSDLLPSLETKRSRLQNLIQIGAVITGIFIMMLFVLFE